MDLIKLYRAGILAMMLVGNTFKVRAQEATLYTTGILGDLSNVPLILFGYLTPIRILFFIMLTIAVIVLYNKIRTGAKAQFKKARKHHKKGVELHKKGKEDEAEEEFNKANEYRERGESIK